MNSLGKIFIRGLITILPIAITIYVLYSAIVILDNLLGHLLRQLLPTYIPGLGILAIIAITFFFGLMLNSLVIGRFLAFAEQKFLEVPLIRAVYAPLRDLMNLFSKQGQKDLRQVVLVKMSENGHMILGLVTRENFEELKLGAAAAGKVAVYLPFSYGLGGYTILVSRENLTQIDIPIEKAMSLAITGWVKSENKDDEDRKRMP